MEEASAFLAKNLIKIEIAESENHLRRIGDFLIFLLGYNEPC